MLTVDVRIRTRLQMNSATPRFANWTYHHVQPVRIYYMTASTILRVITDETSYQQTRALGTNALCKMCNNNPNSATVRTFVDQNRDTETSDDARHAVARLCASPPFGGFPGVNPAQRNDDPHDQAEPLKPLSAHGTWWESLGRIGTEILDAFGLHMMPAPNTDLSATKEAYEWNAIVLSLIGEIEAASVVGAPAFTGKDWKVVDPAADPWTILTTLVQRQAWAAHRRMWQMAYPQMELRRLREQYSYLDNRDIPTDSLIRRGAVPLRPEDDYLNYYI